MITELKQAESGLHYYIAKRLKSVKLTMINAKIIAPDTLEILDHNKYFAIVRRWEAEYWRDIAWQFAGRIEELRKNTK